MAPTAGDERDWESALNEIIDGLQATTALCKHGNHKIHLIGGRWEDDLGFTGCVKGALQKPARPGQPGGAVARNVIEHEPRPVIP